MGDLILTAATVITMDDDAPRAQAVAVSGDTVVAVGSLDDCRAALPGAEVVDTGAAALAPGFVQPQGHPLISGVATQAPARSIAPWDAPTWADVQEATTPATACTSTPRQSNSTVGTPTRPPTRSLPTTGATPTDR